MAMEMALVLDLRKEVDKQKEKAEQGEALHREMSAMAIGLWQQLDELSAINLSLKEGGQSKEEKLLAKIKGLEQDFCQL